MQDLATNDDAQLRRDSGDIEEFLEEARALSSPQAWERVEEAVRRLVRLYGAGLARVIEHARPAGAVGTTFDRLLGDDELLSSVLVLHGLHPLGTEERLRRAIAMLHGRFAIELELVELADGIAYLETPELPDDEALTIIRRVIDASAPELASVEIAAAAA
ncbi:MAG: hypothetical protein ACM31C_08830 [Acidobacteriota bacterium]